MMNVLLCVFRCMWSCVCDEYSTLCFQMYVESCDRDEYSSLCFQMSVESCDRDECSTLCFQMYVESCDCDEAVSGACSCEGGGWETLGETLHATLEGQYQPAQNSD